MIEYLDANPHVFFLVFFAILIFNAIGFYVGGRKAERMFAGLQLDTAKFREKGASGYSEKSIITKMGGASRVLDIIVTESELCVKGIFSAFTYIGTKYDLSHRVPLEKITSASKHDGDVKVSFISREGKHSIVLRLADPDGFLSALKG